MPEIMETPWSNLCMKWFENEITAADLVVTAVLVHGFERASVVEWISDLATPAEMATLRLN